MDSRILFPYFHPSSDLGKSNPPSTKNGSSSPGEKRPWTSLKTSKISKPTSNSNFRGPTSAESNALVLSTEKKRNKLGYHRTSVACGHCRRRKIRCIPAPDDKRCANCIRLKKECNFYPVDQQPLTVLGRRDLKGRGSNERHSRENSSPSTAISSHISDMTTALPYPGHLCMPSIPTLGCSQSKRQRAGSFSPDSNNKVRSENEFGYGNDPGTTNNNSWISSDTLPVIDSSQELPPYWIPNAQESTSLPSGYSPFNTGLQVSPLQHWTNTPGDLSSVEELPWSSPSRTMSLDSLQSSHNHHQYGHLDVESSQTTENHVIKQRGVIPSMSICSSTNPMTAIGSTLGSTSDRSRQTQLAPVLPISIPIAWQQQQQQSYLPHHQRHATSRNSETYGTWNGNNEDSILMKGESDHENLSPYTYGGLGGGIFYPSH